MGNCGTKLAVEGEITVQNRKLLWPQGQTLLQTLLEQDILVDHSCGGNGSCGTCRVWIESGIDGLQERSELESEIANDRQFSPRERLACQLDAVASVQIRLPNEK